MKENKNEIILFENEGLKLEVNLKDETVWLNLDQMSELFKRDKSVISRHIKNIFTEEELDKFAVVANFATTATDGKIYQVDYYNLDVIISVGYRVKSQEGIVFRRWATKILKDYIIKGYAVNQKRLEYLEKTVKLIDIANRMDERLEDSDAKEILKVIGEYSKALDLLDDYDHRTLKEIKKDSSGWGNYKNSKDSIGCITKTGSNEEWCTNRIYDFAGNVKEFTKETYLLTGVVHRGGSYKEQGTEYAVGSRHSEHAYSNICKSEDIGFRVVMYIK